MTDGDWKELGTHPKQAIIGTVRIARWLFYRKGEAYLHPPLLRRRFILVE
jgi:hypothetical protein